MSSDIDVDLDRTGAVLQQPSSGPVRLLTRSMSTREPARKLRLELSGARFLQLEKALGLDTPERVAEKLRETSLGLVSCEHEEEMGSSSRVSHLSHGVSCSDGSWFAASSAGADLASSAA